MRIAKTIVAAGLALALAACGGGDDAATSASAGGRTDEAPTETAAGRGGGIPDGRYVCMYSSAGMLMTLGTVTIRGDRYAGFSGDRFSRYAAGPDGVFSFPAGFVGVPDGFEILAVRYQTSATSDPFIEIEYGSPRGWRDYWTCSIE